ncbi:MAG: ABC transporter substrate-binding protein [Verrucomicrobiota bacterium]
MKSAIALFLFLVFLPAGCAPRQPDPAPEGDRIVSLAPNLTEIVCAVGAGGALVGRTSVCDYPPEIIKSVPVIGGFGAPSMDRLLKTRPTLILDVALEDETVANLMTQLGVRRVRVPCATLADIPTAVLTVGRLAHVESAALHGVIETHARILLEGGRPRPPREHSAKGVFAKQSVGLRRGFGSRKRA